MLFLTQNSLSIMSLVWCRRWFSWWSTSSYLSIPLLFLSRSMMACSSWVSSSHSSKRLTVKERAWKFDCITRPTMETQLMIKATKKIFLKSSTAVQGASQVSKVCFPPWAGISLNEDAGILTCTMIIAIPIPRGSNLKCYVCVLTIDSATEKCLMDGEVGRGSACPNTTAREAAP